MNRRGLRYAFAFSGVFWAVAGVAWHNLGNESLSVLCMFIFYGCVAGIITTYVRL